MRRGKAIVKERKEVEREREGEMKSDYYSDGPVHLKVESIMMWPVGYILIWSTSFPVCNLAVLLLDLCPTTPLPPHT